MNMTSAILSFPPGNNSGSLSEKVATFSDHLRREREARELQSEHYRAEQRNECNTPHARIAAWEKLHALQLPSECEHPILLTIAEQTRMSLAQVRDEQAARAASRPGRLAGENVDLDVYAPKKIASEIRGTEGGLRY